jgi:hypothetical protein
MMRRVIRTAGVLVLASIPSTGIAQLGPGSADSVGPSTTRNVAGPPELAQLDFLVGDWDVTVTLARQAGEPLVYRARWHNRWVGNGYVMMQEWHQAGSSGVELRSFNPNSRKWDGRNLYVPDPGVWYANEAEWQGSQLVVTTHSRTPDGTPTIGREVYVPIAGDRFEIHTQMSADGGRTWTPGGYRAVAIRSAGTSRPCSGVP